MADLKGLKNKRSGIAAYPLTESDIVAANLCMQEAFPPGEQFPIEQLLRFAAGDPARSWLDLWFLDQQFAGFTYTTKVPGDADRTYLAYLAISGALRGKGLGTEILRRVTAENTETLWCLGVERPIAATPEYAARTRRLRFYARNGWIDTGIHAIDCGVDFELLTRRRPVPPGTQMDIINGFWESLAQA